MFVLFLGIILSLNTVLASSSKIEIQAKSIESTGDIATATNNVVVHYDDMVIRAASAVYNKNTHLLMLDGNIETIGYKGTKEHSSHMEINTETKEVTFKELFLVSENDVWIMSQDVNKKNKTYKLGTSLLSSCDITDPLWTMRFSHSNYNQDENYIRVYNAKVYMWDVPVFYTPYLAFSTNKQRSSGLLFPLFGYNDVEGFIYEQPIFWAISPSVDVEFNPQIRTSRSAGLYSTLRFVDSNHSKGTLRVGYFKDFDSYTQEYNIPNSSHYGLEFNYESSEVFKKYLPKGFQDGLYVNTTYLNDIDYLTLQKNNLSHFGLSPLQESRVNYFAQDNDYYVGLNAKYFIDTRTNIDDDKTVQILPSIQMHKYLDELFTRNLTYSADFKINNFDRKKGATMKQAEMRIPLEFATSFFDDFVNLSLGEEFYYSKFFFGNGDFVYDDYQYYSNIHKAKIFTDLTKNYDSFIHVLQPSLSYLKPGTENQSPIEFSQLNPEQKELFTVGLPEEQYNFALSQYFYDQNMKLKFYQRLTQKYYVDREYKFADLNNEMQYNFNAIQLYNIIGYSHEFKKVRFSSTSIAYKQADYRLTLGHSYKKVLPDDPTTRPANDVSFDFGYTYNQKVAFSGGLTYNIDDSTSKQWKIGGSYHRDCWSIASSIRQDIQPSSAGSISQTTFYMQLDFTPFGSIGTDTLK
ncbi:MAG: LPS-assembly protein LptD [Epsilonproteobacteria bacterium]|nr:LPS-assembly protein LptD [Campylobacterota bacterium]